MIAINPTKLRSTTIMNAELIRTEQRERKQSILCECERAAEKLFEIEYANILSAIEKQVKKGLFFYDYPILAHSWDRKVWHSVQKLKDGSPWIFGRYRMIWLTVRNIYHEDMFDFWEARERPNYALTDEWEKEKIIYGLLARKISGRLLRKKLAVSIGRMEVVPHNHRHEQLRCLHIAW